MKRKLIFCALAVVMIFAMLFSLAACDKKELTKLEPKDEYLGNHHDLDVAEGMSAYDLVMEAYENWINDTNYVRDEYFAFAADGDWLGIVATRDTHLIRKVVGDKIYSQEIIYGTGADSGTCAKRYYFDGAKAYSSNNTNKKDISKDGDEVKTAHWNDFSEFTGDIAEENRVLTEHLTTYDISKKEYLSDKHDDKVYEKDGVYYCTITINCSNEMMQTVHKAAFEEFLDMTGAKAEGFSIEDTTIDFAIAEIDGKMKFLIWKRNEKYSGQHNMFPITVSCEQTCLSYYTYGDAEITSDDLLNLA